MNSPAARRRHPFAGALVLLLALLVTGALYAVIAPASTAEAAGLSRQAEATSEIEQGRQLFLANCSTCHGLNGEGTSDGPHLVGVGAAAVDFQVGTGRMPAWVSHAVQVPQTRQTFTQEEINAMAAYVATLGPGPEIPDADLLAEVDELSAEEIALGGELFRINCAMCHGASGAGGALTGGKYAPSLWGSDRIYIWEAMTTGPQSMPVFGETLPEEEKLQIIGYVESLNEQVSYGGLTLGAVGPVSEGALAWIGGLGALIAVAVWLGAKSS